MALTALLMGCGGSSGGDGGVTFARPAVQVAGLAPGQGVSVSLNGGQVVTFTSDGRQTFSEQLANGDRFTLQVTGTSGGASCVFNNGQEQIQRTTVTQDTPLTCGEPGGGDPSDPTDPVPPTDPDGGTGELRILTATGQDRSMVSMALRVVRDDGPYVGAMVLDNLRVLHNGRDAPGHVEEFVRLDATPEARRLLTVHVDISLSMRGVMPAIRQALSSLRAHMAGDHDHRLYVAIFDAGPETTYFFPSAHDMEPSEFDVFLGLSGNGGQLPRDGAYQPGSDLSTGLINAAQRSGDTASGVHYDTHDAVIITDGNHLAGDLNIPEIQSALPSGRVTIIAYGEDVNTALLEATGAQVYAPSSSAQLATRLQAIADGQTARSAGVRLLHHIIAPQERQGSDSYMLELEGAFCTTGACTASREVTGAAGNDNGTLVQVSDRQVFSRELVKFKALRWVDEWLGDACNGTGTYYWGVPVGDDLFEPIESRDDFVIYAVDGSVEHLGSAPVHEVQRTNDSSYIRVRSTATGTLELAASTFSNFWPEGCRGLASVSVVSPD